MKVIIYGTLIFLLSAFLISCNPQKRIIMRNASSDDAEIIWKINEDSVNVSRLYISNSTEVKFHLQPGKPYNFADMSFGIGSWSDAELNNLADDLESLEVKSRNQNFKLSIPDEIKKYLLENRKGFGKTKIRITITN